MRFCARLAAPRRRLVELSTLTAKTTYTTPSPGRHMLSLHALPSVLPIRDQRQPVVFREANYACTGTIIETRRFSCRPGRPTWTSETLLLGQAAPQGRKAELRPLVPAFGAPAASALVQRSGHRRSGCGQFHAAVCSVCSGTCISHGCWLRVEDARRQNMHSTPSLWQRLQSRSPQINSIQLWQHVQESAPSHGAGSCCTPSCPGSSAALLCTLSHCIDGACCCMR